MLITITPKLIIENYRNNQSFVDQKTKNKSEFPIKKRVYCTLTEGVTKLKLIQIVLLKQEENSGKKRDLPFELWIER